MTSVLSDVGPLAPADLTLRDWEVEQLLNLARSISADPVLDAEEFCAEAERATRGLSPRVAEALRLFHRWGSESGMLVVSGLPVEDLPPTPEDDSRHLGLRTILARAQAIINEFLGSMIAYEGAGGLLFQDLVPGPVTHADEAFGEPRPDYLSLACLRGDPRAETYVLSARRLLAHCTPEEADMLWEPRWTSVIGPRSFGRGTDPMPILAGAPDDPVFVLDPTLIRGVDLDAQALLDRVGEIYRAEREAHVLRPGELMIIDRARTSRGRSDFSPRSDGADRFLVRSFVVRDLNRSRHVRAFDSRVVLAGMSDANHWRIA